MTVWDIIALANAGDSGAKSIFTFRGTVNTINDLPETGEDGDVYLVDSEDSYFAWDGEGWTDVGNIFTIEDEEDLEKARTALQPEDLEPYRTASAQDVIDDAQDDRLDDLEQSTTAATVGPSAVASFEAEAADMPLKQLTVNIEPVQAGSGDPSPVNVRPISGWTGCKILTSPRRYINFTPGVTENNGIRYGTTEDGAIFLSGTATETSVLRYYFTEDERAIINAATALYFGGGVAGGNSDTSFGLTLATNSGTKRAEAQNTIVRVTSNISSIGQCSVIVRSGVNVDGIVFRPFLLVENKGIIYPVAFPSEAGTVYGGTLDVVNKRMTSEKQLFVFNGGEADIAAHGTIPNWFSIRFLASQYSNVYVNDALSNFAISNQFIQRRYADINYAELPTQNEFAVGVTNGYLRFVFRPVSIGTLEDFKAALIATPVQVLCNLINDVPFDIVAPDITTLLGENNIWADCGDVTVTYGAYLETLKASLDRTNGELDTLRACIAPIEDGATASQAYAAGAYFFRNGSFCTALTAITSGAAFTLGTNYQTTTVAAALIALQS